MPSIILSWITIAKLFSSSVRLQYNDIPEVATIYYIVYTRHHQLKTDWYQNNKIKMYQCLKKLVKCKEYSYFNHSAFPAYSVFTSDVCWGSLGNTIFWNSSSAANNVRSRLASTLSFRFLWLYVRFGNRIVIDWKVINVSF